MVFHGFGLSPVIVDMLLSDMDPSCGSSGKHGQPTFCRRIPVDILEKEHEFEIMADVPGVEKEAIQLDVDKDTLILSVSAPSATQATPAPAPDAEAPPATDGTTPSEPAAAPGAGGEPDEAGAAAQPKVLHRERARRFAKRALKLPETADLGQARAECVAGVLTVKVPKKPLPSPQRIPIA